jgi:hypothetical protein
MIYPKNWRPYSNVAPAFKEPNRRHNPIPIFRFQIRGTALEIAKGFAKSPAVRRAEQAVTT